MIYLFVDESGTLPDIKDKYVVISGVGVKKIKEAENLISRILSSLRKRKIKIKEVKFYYAGEQTKRQFLSGIVSSNLEIFALIIDKKERKIADTPENFAILISDLINEAYLWYKKEKISVVIDKHFHRKTDQDRFNNFIRKQIAVNLKYVIKHVDSQQNFLVNIADMTAGAILWKYNRKNDQFYQIIKDNIAAEKLVNWPELKRKTMAK